MKPTPARPWLAIFSRTRVHQTLAGLFLCAGALAIVSCRSLPAPAPSYDLRTLNQGWSPAQRAAYYHTAQGTQIIPYDWFMALEQPLNSRSFHADDNLSRYRFLPDPSTANNPDRLAVGMTRDVDELTGETYFGLTCAACHTGQLQYRGMGIRIDGGEGTLDLTAFIEDMFTSLYLTELFPAKFDRFAHQVLGDQYSPDTKRALHAAVAEKVREVKAIKSIADRRHLYPVQDGFGRQDALGRGGNNGFSLIGIETNYVVADAAVSYPAVWNAINWDWVQYNGSIHQPMTRNIGEVMGVGAAAVLHGKPEDFYDCSVKLRNLQAIETLVGGLHAPAWPEDVLGPIDVARANQGKALFATRCAMCHEPKWNETTHAFSVKLIPLAEIGTDPKQARNLADRKVNTGDLGYGIISGGAALQLVTGKIAERKYKELGISPEEQSQMNFGRSNLFAANLAYRAHSLTGIWATPPYLHNGSVPNLYELLSPVEERSKTFYTGNLEYDPVHVGYQKDSFPGGMRFDTTLPGNSNAGHEFRAAPLGNGVIGPRLTPEERLALVEYLKTR